MTEDEHRTWDIRLQAIAPFITVAGLLVGVWQFTAGERHTREREHALAAAQDSVEFRRRIWDQQLDAFRQVAKAAGEVASSTDDHTRFGKAVREFETLYWGLSVFTADPAVEEKLHDLHVEISDYQKGKSSADRLRLRSEALVTAMRQSLTRTWTSVQRGV
jgi:hypothetical protein